MRRYNVKLSRAAETDLIGLYEWVHEAAGEPVADRFYRRLAQAADSLSYFPERGVLRESIAAGARLLIIGNYVILYQVRDNDVDVMRFVHGSVDMTKLLS